MKIKQVKKKYGQNNPLAGKVKKSERDERKQRVNELRKTGTARVVRKV